MATLLRKMWESVSNRSRSGSNSNSPERFRCVDSPLGVFEQIPSDILIQILKLLDPKEVAKLTLVCKAWRSLASDNRLWIYFLQNNQLEPWDTIFFAETNLRSRHPLPTLVGQMPQLSFKRIYDLRKQVPGAVIIDGGSGYCKFGWSKYGSPSGRSATFLEFGNLESPMYTRLRHFFATIYSRMQVKPSTHPVIVSIPICHYDDTESAKASRQQLKEAICAALFDMNVPAICAVNQATLSLYAAKQTSGIAVNVGFQVTSIVPILNGKVMHKVGVEVVGLGAIKLTGFLRELMQQNNMNLESLYTVRTLKENLCYVAIDYEAELSKDTQASFEAAGEGWFTLSKERFQTGEILFQPRLAGLTHNFWKKTIKCRLQHSEDGNSHLRCEDSENTSSQPTEVKKLLGQAMGLHQAVALCIDHCHTAELAADPDWFKTVVLSGGTACLPGLAERLDKELHELLPPELFSGIKVIPPPYGADTAWFGGRTIGNLSTFPGPWCIKKKQFHKSRLNLIW